MMIPSCTTEPNIQLFASLTAMGNHLFKIGDVTFLKEIGHGSFGKVYEAERKGQTVAAKQLHKHIYIKNRSVVDKFFTECGTLRGLNHRNIVTMIDVLVPGGEIPPVLITELLFCDLAQYLKKHGSIELPKVVSIALDVAEGLRYLHKRSLPIAHRDLASKNVLLTLDGTAKIADFGLVAVFVQPELASPNPGTPVYAAPETFLQTTSGGQHGSKEYDVRVDVFAFGVLVLEMITGHRPRPTSPVGEGTHILVIYGAISNTHQVWRFAVPRHIYTRFCNILQDSYPQTFHS